MRVYHRPGVNSTGNRTRPVAKSGIPVNVLTRCEFLTPGWTPMAPAPADSLLAAFRRLTHPRHRRGVRPPLPGLLATIFLGLLCRQPDFASIARWAKRHWPALK